MKQPLLELKQLTVTDARQKTLIHNVSFTVGENECVGIIGESGSGKTMTARALLGLLSPDLRMSASVMKLKGQDLLSLTPQARRRAVSSTIGFVPQNTVAYLHPLIRIRNQIADGYLTLNPKARPEAMQKAEQLLGSVGIADPRRVLNNYPGQLSGGMRQRVNIAMALMNDPQLILADEPTTALDCIVQKQVMELFDQLHQQRGTALVLISHNLDMLEKYCDRILVMYAGQIVEAGPTQAVYRHPRHPYTQALISVIPRLDQDPDARLAEIGGYVPEKDRGRASCLFADRCPACTPRCRQPLNVEEHTGHFVRCCFPKGEKDHDCNPA